MTSTPGLLNLKTIKRRILAFAILATLIPATGLGLISFWRYQSLISENVAHELRVLVDYTGNEVELWLKERVNEVRSLSTSNTIIDALSAVTRPRPGAGAIGAYELGMYLRSVQKKLDSLLELTVADVAGHVVASSASNPTPIVLPATSPDVDIAQGFAVDSPHWDDARKTATLTITVPMRSADNTRLGTLSAVVDLGSVRQRLQNIAKSSAADVILLAPDGRPLQSAHAAASALTALDPEILRRLREQSDQPVSFRGHRQQGVLGLAKVLSSPPLIVVAERDSTEVYDAWRRLLDVYVLLVVGLVLLVGVIGYRMGRSIVTPLNGLIGATDRIANGDLSTELRVAENDEIGHLTRVFNKMTDNLRRSRAAADVASQTLQQQNELLEVLSVRDGLTGLYNRKKLDEILNDQFARFRRTQRAFAVLMLDVDNFKAINDREGHLAGDEVLEKVAAVLAQSIRNIDYAARYGGEEFVIVLVETETEAALAVAERIRALIESTRHGMGSISVTISVGVTDSRNADDSPEAMLARADRALYAAKRAGRNKVQRAD